MNLHSNIVPGGNKTPENERIEKSATIYLMQDVAKYNVQVNKKAEVMVTDTLETVDVDDEKVDEITIKIATDKLGQIKAVFDSGASICCIEANYARKYYRKYIKAETGFKVRTANGTITLGEYIHLKITEDGKQFLVRWYLLPKSPFRFILSRKLFRKLGYVIGKPGQFMNRSKCEDLNHELYKGITKHLEDEIPTTKQIKPKWSKQRKRRVGEIITLIQRYDNGQARDVRQLFEDRVRIPHICALEEIVNDEVITEISGQIKAKEVRQEFEELICQNDQSYAKDATDIGTIPGEEFEIKLKPKTTPIHSKPYPLPYQQSDEIEKQINQLLEAKLITKSKSPWASPVIVVPKPTRNGKKEFRMCIDYRALNEKTIKDRYRIPSMRDLYRKLQGNRIFSNIDLRSGYYHIPIKEEDRAKTAFITDQGLFEWTRMTFGFSNAPATFQRAMDRIFQGLDFVVIYLDDVIICSKTEKEHMKHLKIIFDRIRQFKLKLRLIKCKFFQREIKYLGMIVNEKGIKCDKEYVMKVLDMKIPTNGKEIERFLGMVNWLGKFIPNLSKLTGPFSKMKNKGFYWNEAHDLRFEAIKNAVSKAKILRHPDFSKPFMVQTDASNTAIGAVLLQDFGNGYLEPIEFASRKLADNELNWHVSDKELIAVVFALEKWIRYLLPNHFIVFTDHKNLEELFNHGKSKKNQRLHRWIIMLQQFNFTAKYLPGKENYIADYLSRDVSQETLLANEIMTIETARNNKYLYGQIEHIQRNKEEITAIQRDIVRPRRRSSRLATKEKKNYTVDETFEALLQGRKPTARQKFNIDKLPEIQEKGKKPRKKYIY